MECSTLNFQRGVVEPYGSCKKAHSVYPNQEINIPTLHPKVKPHSLLARMALPCQNSSNWNYDECYSYYANGCYNTCQFVATGDIEDFM